MSKDGNILAVVMDPFAIIIYELDKFTVLGEI